MPQISVIVPVYKTKPYLEKCVDSLLSQTYADFEIILVDDGSPDESGTLCDALALKDKRIRVIHKENGGLTSARKAGWTVASGEYVSFVDSDDYVHPQFLDKLITAAQKYDAELAMCSYTLVNSQGERHMYLPWQEEVINKEDIAKKYALPLIGRIYDQSHINLPGFMCLRLFKKNSLRHEYFVSEREVFTEDDIFDLYHSEQIEHLAVVNEPLYYYVQHPESLSNRYRKGKWEMLQKRYLLCEKWLQANGLRTIGDERLKAAAVSAVCASVNNAVQMQDYKAFCQAIDEIRITALFQKVFLQAPVMNMAKSHRITYYLMKYKLTRLLYCYGKLRLAK